MDVAVLGVMIPIIALIGTFTVIVYLRKYENVERLSMIDKGISPEIFNRRRTSSTSVPLRISLLMIGAGIGLLAGYFLDRAFYMDEVAYFSMLFIFGGLGLGTAYVIEEKKMKKGNES
jgi:F0F1-type ATP synthase assembly protein I